MAPANQQPGGGKLREEDFLSVLPCPFRRVSFGTSFCTISTDAFIAEVDPLTCLNCEVPAVIRQPRCRFLSLGTELRPFRGEGKLVVAMACRELGIKIYNLNTCDKCGLYSEVASIVDEIKHRKQKADVKLEIPAEMVREVANIVRRERSREEFAPPEEEPSFDLRCWRFEDGQCRKVPVYARGKATVILTVNQRNEEVFARTIRPALKELNLTVYRIKEELDNEEELCRACENIQESDFVVTSIDEWNSNMIFLLGLVHGFGRRLAVLKRSNVAAVPLVEMLSHCVVEYSSLPEIIFLLKHRFSPLVKHSQERGG
jgi:hypothetical protein